MIRYALLMIIFSAQTCVAQPIPFPSEEMESLFAGMRQLEDDLGPHAFVASVKLTKDWKGKVESHNRLCLGAVTESGQRLVGYATTDRGIFWKLRLTEKGENHCLFGRRNQLVPVSQLEQEKFFVRIFDPLYQTTTAISSVLFNKSKPRGQHHRRSGENLKDFKRGENFVLLYEEPGTLFVKTKRIRFRFDQKPTPNVVQWDVEYVLKGGEEMDVASTVTQWGYVQGHYVPKAIFGTTSMPGNGPSYFGEINIQWNFEVPEFDKDASDWIDTLATVFPVDPFSGE